MKIKIISTAVVLLLGLISGHAQKRIEFSKLNDYVGDYDHRRNGERFIVPDAPVASEVNYIKGYKMYVFTAEDEGVREVFYTSAPIAKSLRKNLNTRAVLLSITCVVIEIASDQDTYRAPFATKIDGINMDGEVVWTVTGPPPAKLKFR
jgi:hypothetical protein